MRSSKLLFERILAQGLQIAVSTNMLLANKDVRHRALVGHLLKRILDRSTIICESLASALLRRTHFITANDLRTARVTSSGSPA